MNRERFQKTLETLREVKEQNLPLNMSKWKCDTAACAFGYVAQSKWANEEGLYLERVVVMGYSPRYERNRDFNSVAAFYDITLDQAKHLFDPYKYYNEEISIGDITVNYVIERIEELLKEKE